MSEEFCTHHRQVRARWRCLPCEFRFCVHCVPLPEYVDRVPECLCCQQPLESLGSTNVIPPLTEKLGLFFRIPLQIELAASIVFQTLLWALAASSPPWSLLLLLVASIVFGLTSNVVMHRIAHGYLKPPRVPLPDRPGFGRLVVQGLVLLVLFGGAGLAAAAGPMVLAGVLFVGSLMLVPAAMLTVIVTRRAWLAINPLWLIAVAGRIGRSYLFLCALILLLSAGSQQLQSALTEKLPLWASLAVSGLFSTYFGYVTAALMGYVAYQAHEVFGQRINERGETPAGAVQVTTPPPDRVQLLLLRGRAQEAQAELEKMLKAAPENLELHGRYQKLLVARREREAAAAHADYLIGRLVETGRSDKALEVYLAFVGALGPLEVKDGTDVVRLTEAGLLASKGKTVLPLLDKFAQRFPNHAEIPRAWLLSARILIEDLRDDARGRLILQALLKRYPADPVAAQAQRLLVALDRAARPATLVPKPAQG